MLRALDGFAGGRLGLIRRVVLVAGEIGGVPGVALGSNLIFNVESRIIKVTKVRTVKRVAFFVALPRHLSGYDDALVTHLLPVIYVFEAHERQLTFVDFVSTAGGIDFFVGNDMDIAVRVRPRVVCLVRDSLDIDEAREVLLAHQHIVEVVHIVDRVIRLCVLFDWICFIYLFKIMLVDW